VELDHLAAFVTIVRKGGVRLPKHEGGAQRFARTRSGVVLTNVGRALLPPAEGPGAAMRDAVDTVAGPVVLVQRRPALLSGASRAVLASSARGRPPDRLRRA